MRMIRCGSPLPGGIRDAYCSPGRARKRKLPRLRWVPLTSLAARSRRPGWPKSVALLSWSPWWPRPEPAVRGPPVNT